jgi:hypothetical protein
VTNFHGDEAKNISTIFKDLTIFFRENALKHTPGIKTRNIVFSPIFPSPEENGLSQDQKIIW